MSKKKKKEPLFLTGVNLVDAFDKLRKVHKAIPSFDFDCKNCKDNCCVSPYISIVEFLYVASHILRTYEDPYKVLLRDNGRNKYGIQICPFLDNDGRCLIYNVRHYKCRMTGMDIVDSIFTEVCLHKKEVGLVSPEITKSEWAHWIEILTRINKAFQFDDQLKFEEWLEFYFEEDYRLKKNEIKARNFLRNYLHIEEHIPQFRPEDIL